jgi:hypothetical protein
MLIKEGQRDAVSAITFWSGLGASTKTKIENINTISALGRAFETIDKVSQQRESATHTEQINLNSTVVEQRVDMLNLKQAEKTIETITPEKLMLSAGDQEFIQTYAKTIGFNYKVYMKVIAELPSESDPIRKAQIEIRLEDLKSNICKDFDNITKFLRDPKTILENYRPYQFFCKEAK